MHKSEVKRLLKDLIPYKAPGPDDISPLELKLASGKIAATVAAVAGAYVGFQVKSRRMFALCENHEFVKT